MQHSTVNKTLLFVNPGHDAKEYKEDEISRLVDRIDKERQIVYVSGE